MVNTNIHKTTANKHIKTTTSKTRRMTIWLNKKKVKNGVKMAEKLNSDYAQFAQVDRVQERKRE